MSNDSSKIDKASWDPWFGIFFAVFIFIAAQVAAGILLSFILQLVGWTGDRAVTWINDSAFAKLAYFLITGSIIILSTWQFLKQQGSTLKDIGLRRPKWIDPVYSVSALPVYVVLFAGIAAIAKIIFPELNINQEQDLGLNGTYSGIDLAMIGLALVVVAPIIEEIVFRGLLFGSLKRVVPIIAAAIITSLLFAAGHIVQGADGNLLYIAAIDTFVLSTILIFLREISGGLWASIGLHALKNCIAFISVFVLAAH